MKAVDIQMLDRLPGRRLADRDRFCFHCRPELECFNRCCRNLNLFLYPYDVLRLKNRLDMHSGRFLDRYVDVVMRKGHFFPDVVLRMAEDRRNRCPFVTATGCSVYADRPGTCRLFPVEQGRYYEQKARRWRLVSFFRPPDFCLGPQASTTWSVSSWSADQDDGRYQEMTLRWANIVARFDKKTWGAEGPMGAKGKMAFMAVYNLDAFREFVFTSSFLNRYRLNTDLSRNLGRDDRLLLQLGLDWLSFFLWGVKPSSFRPR